MRRISMLQGGRDDPHDPLSQPNTAAFLQALQQLGWTDGRNVKIGYRWSAGDIEKARTYASEVVALAPDATYCMTANWPIPEVIAGSRRTAARVTPGVRSA